MISILERWNELVKDAKRNVNRSPLNAALSYFVTRCMVQAELQLRRYLVC